VGKVLFRNVASNWTGMFVSMLVAFFMMPFVIRELGTIAYGFWVLLQSLTSYMFLLDFGVRSSLNRHLAKFHAQGEPQEVNRVINTGLAVYCTICVTVILLSCFLGLNFERFFSVPELDSTTILWAVILVGSGVALHFPTAVFDSVLTGLQRYDLMNMAQLLSLSVRTGLIVVALKLGYGLLAISLATFLSSLLQLFLVYVLTTLIYPGMRFDFSLASFRTLKLLANHSFYAYILIGATHVITVVGNLIVGAFVGVAAVTFYAIAGSLTTYATNIISGISTTIPPAASKLEAEGDYRGLQALCLSGTKFILLTGWPILFTFILTGERFICLWVGEEFRASYPPLVLLSLSWACNYLQSAAACVLMGLSRHKAAAWLVLAQAVLNLGISLVLVRSIGTIGVAWGAFLSSAIMNLVFQVHALHLLGISLWSFLKHAILPTIIAFIPFILMSTVLSYYLFIDNFLSYFMHIFLSLFVMIILLPFIGMNKNERNFIHEKLCRYILKRNFEVSF
jgi:O-antigen/teichoic acid export membrane protein